MKVKRDERKRSGSQIVSDTSAVSLLISQSLSCLVT